MRSNRIKYATTARLKPDPMAMRNRSKGLFPHTCHFLATLKGHFASPKGRSEKDRWPRYRLPSLAEITVTRARIFSCFSYNFLLTAEVETLMILSRLTIKHSGVLVDYFRLFFSFRASLNRQEGSPNNRFYTVLFFWADIVSFRNHFGIETCISKSIRLPWRINFRFLFIWKMENRTSMC